MDDDGGDGFWLGFAMGVGVGIVIGTVIIGMFAWWAIRIATAGP